MRDAVPEIAAPCRIESQPLSSFDVDEFRRVAPLSLSNLFSSKIVWLSNEPSLLSRDARFASLFRTIYHAIYSRVCGQRVFSGASPFTKSGSRGAVRDFKFVVAA